MKKSKKIENYTLYEIIKEFNYGIIYKATHKKDNKQYAIKAIPIRNILQNHRLQERLVNQISILENIEEHIHIVKFIETLKTANNFYFVYEYCNGGTLDKFLKQTPISEKEALLIFRQLRDTLQVFYKYNIMLRDISPDDFLFNNGIVKLGGFSANRSLNQNHIGRTIIGIPFYMPPEILKGQSYSTKASAWFLGIVLYQMLQGCSPFRQTSMAQFLQDIRKPELQFPPSNRISDEIKNLLKKLLAKDPKKRIQWKQLQKLIVSNQGQLLYQNSSLLNKDVISFESQKLRNPQILISKTMDDYTHQLHKSNQNSTNYIPFNNKKYL